MKVIDTSRYSSIIKQSVLSVDEHNDGRFISELGIGTLWGKKVVFVRNPHYPEESYIIEKPKKEKEFCDVLRSFCHAFIGNVGVEIGNYCASNNIEINGMSVSYHGSPFVKQLMADSFADAIINKDSYDHNPILIEIRSCYSELKDEPFEMIKETSPYYMLCNVAESLYHRLIAGGARETPGLESSMIYVGKTIDASKRESDVYMMRP